MNKFIYLILASSLIACKTEYDPPHPPEPPPPGTLDAGSNTSINNVMASSDAGTSVDVDAAPAPKCGDVGQPLCQLGETCAKHADCASTICSYKHVCLPESEKSCSGHFGGDTCGIGETGTPDAKHGSCCETAPLFNELSNVQMDRWLITAGRMRTFIERLHGDVRSYVQTLPSNVWKPEYDQYVPSSMAEADEQLGSYFNKKACNPGDYTGRTYWTPPTPTDYSDFTKDQMDEKALNCVTWHLVTAFCAWTGGRMSTTAEIQNAFTNGGKYIQPWLWQPGAVQYYQPEAYENNTPATSTFNHAFGYGYPLTNVRSNPNLDIAFHISPPGRYPQSWNMHGHEIAGNLLEWNATAPSYFSATYSWENHGGDSVGDSNWALFQQVDAHQPNGYYAIGGRCSR